MKLIYFCFNWMVKISGFIPSLFVFKIKPYYEDKSKQSRKIKGKAIVVGNHRDVWDFALMLFLFPWRTLRCVVAELMYEKNPAMSFFLKAAGCIKVERDAHDFGFISKCKDILDHNGVVEIFPESRLNRDPEVELLEFKPSAIYLALESGAPIIPVYSNNQYFKKKPIKAMIGTPFCARDLYDDSLSEKENIAKINDLLRGKILELKHELERKEKEENRS